jgi:DNA-binding response OmpR family regulator
MTVLPILSGKVLMGGENRGDAMYDRGEKGTVLIAEDNEQIRNLTEIILVREGYRVLSAESGGAALDILHSCDDPIHVMLVDLVMPGMGGKDLYYKAREIHEGIKVVYMSGYDSDQIEERGNIAAGEHFLQKPFSISSLVKEIRNVLDS